MKTWWKTLHKALKCLLHITVQSKPTVILLSNVLCKFLLLLLSLPPLLGTFFLFMRIWWKSKYTHCLIMHSEAESNPWVNANLRFICRVDVPSLLWYHSSIYMIYCGINCTILNCLWCNTLSISNRVCRVQSQLLCNISQSERGMRYSGDVAQSLRHCATA